MTIYCAIHKSVLLLDTGNQLTDEVNPCPDCLADSAKNAVKDALEKVLAVPYNISLDHEVKKMLRELETKEKGSE